MSGNLRQRLARIRNSRTGIAEEAELLATGVMKSHEIPVPNRLDGWTAIGEGVFKRENIFLIPSFFSAKEIIPGIFSRNLPSIPVPICSVCFFDLETTGLSGGAGTVAFLAAIGRLDGSSRLIVHQYFLKDYPYEPEFLDCIEKELNNLQVVVTYNGSSFDMPLYSMRRGMNRLAPSKTVQHIDALHAARKLWRKPIGNCSLQNIETVVLDTKRDDDVPGSEIPSVWFDFLKRGSDSRLEKVFDHNAQDIVSLVNIFLSVGLSVDGSTFPKVYDPVGLAELQSRVDVLKAETTLKSILDAGEKRAARPLMRLLAAQGRFVERTAIVPHLPDDAAGLFSKSVYAERILKDMESAVDLARRAWQESRHGSDLQTRARKREDRLRKRLSLAGSVFHI
jgi:uncharacterized protein YprB with RNaseH-like and TPR domain